MTNVCGKSPSVFVTPIQSQIILVESENETEVSFILQPDPVKQANQAHHTTYADKGYVGTVRPTHSLS
jgi:hypothetical protein